MAEKAADPLILEKCPDIRWHFIGNCQTNKVPKVVKSPNISIVETVSSVKLADKLQSSCKSNNVTNLAIMIQVRNQTKQPTEAVNNETGFRSILLVKKINWESNLRTWWI